MSSSAAERLDQLLIRQRALAWLLSAATLAVTVAFFAMMTLAGPLMARVVLGRSITLATVSAATIIAMYLLSIAYFGRRADRIDALMRAARSDS